MANETKSINSENDIVVPLIKSLVDIETKILETYFVFLKNYFFYNR